MTTTDAARSPGFRQSVRSTLPTLSSLLLASIACAQTADRDGDGLTDFHEVHKYGTDPAKADSDGDGVRDGDWRERREFAYTVRSIVQVMRPVTTEYLNDDYQDVRVLDETADYVELEVVHYPFNSVHSALKGDDRWQKQRPRAQQKEVGRWLEPGPTSDSSPALGRRIRRDLAADGIELAKLDDVEAVRAVSKWLMRRSKFHTGFTIFVTAFDDQGKAHIPKPFAANAQRSATERETSIEAQWQQEVFASGMYDSKLHGSCSSTAIYLSGCLRAIGIPTRTVLCIPLIDASDPTEHHLLDAIQHNSVRELVRTKAEGGRNAWTSHTFNEVFVGGRWVRLNYDNLGQNILDRSYLGLMTHVATFHDWADAKFAATVGMRQKGHRKPNDPFRHKNPYSTLTLRDEFGVHCRLTNPPLPSGEVPIVALHWTDAKALPDNIRASCADHGRTGLIARIDNMESQRLRSLLRRADPDVILECDQFSDLHLRFEPDCWWLKDGTAWIWLRPVLPSPAATGKPGATYRAKAQNDSSSVRWILPGDPLRRG